MSLVLQKPYTIEYLEVSPAKNITSKNMELKKMTHYDIQKTNTAAIILDARYGAFITNDNGGDTPILLNDYDQFRITLTDPITQVTYKRIYELRTDLSQKVVTGMTLPLELLGRDHNLDTLPCRGNFEVPNTISFYDVIQYVADQYNKQRGSKQPFLSTALVVPPTAIDLNEAPKNIRIAIDFSDKPNCREALKRILSRMNLDIARGGTGKKWSIVIDDHPTDDSTMLLKVFPQGKLPGTPVTVRNSSTHRIHSIAKRKEAKTATKVYVEGQEGEGRYPENPHRFFSQLEAFNAHPKYDSTLEYEAGIRVIHDGVHYEASQDVPVSTTPPNATYWNVITEKDVIGSYQVSPWTQDKAGLIQNFFSNPENPLATNFNSPAIIDGNAVIRESNFWRDWVLLRSNTDQLNSDPIKKHYLWLQNNAGRYESLRILVDTKLGNPAGSFGDGAGTVYKDRFGKSYANALVQWDGDEWIVIREATDGDYCAVRAEGKNYAYIREIINPKVRHKSSAFTSPSGPIEWRDVSEAFLGNDCFHYPKTIQNVKGLFRDIDAPIGKYNDNSAIEITYEYTLDPITTQAWLALVSIADAILPGDQADELTTLNIYNAGWWAPLFFAPSPENTLNSIQEEIGELYGGQYDATDPKKRFGVIDLVNENRTHSGLQGMNNSESHELGELDGFFHHFKLEIKRNGGKLPFQGNIPISCFVFDSESHVWKATKNYRIHGDIDDTFHWKWDEFKIYKGRTPWGVNTLLSNIVVPELDIRDIFEQKKVKFAIIQMDRSYDDVGRYQPYNFDNWLQAFGGGVVSFVGAYDLCAFSKKPVSTTPVVADRAIIPDPIQASNIRNLVQLESIAFAEKDLREFQYEGYSVEDDLRIDISPETAFYLEDKEIINQNDNGSDTQQLTMKDLYYKVDASGAAKRVFTGVEQI